MDMELSPRLSKCLLFWTYKKNMSLPQYILCSELGHFTQCLKHTRLSTSRQPLRPPLRSRSLSRSHALCHLSPLCCPHPTPPPPYPPVSTLPSVVEGVVNAMSFLSLSAVRVASAGDEFPVDSFVFAEHSDSQYGVIAPELATCENSSFGSPLLR